MTYADKVLLGNGGEASVSTRRAQPGAESGSVVIGIKPTWDATPFRYPLTPSQARVFAAALIQAALECEMDARR